MAKLNAASRAKLAPSTFCVPPDGFPIPDRAHGAAALSRASGKPIYEKVRACVCRKFPDMPSCKVK